MENAALLAGVATASLRPDVALPGLVAHPSSEAVYESLRGLVWTLVAGREDGDFVDLWCDAILRLGAKMRDKAPDVAERLTALTDLLAQSSAFARFHPASEIAERPSTKRILATIADSGTTDMETLAHGTGIPAGNLAPLVANLAAAGFLKRERTGGGDLLVSPIQDAARSATR